MKLLHLDSSILPPDASVSRTVSAAVVDHIRKTTPDLTVVRRDLFADPLPHLTISNLPAVHPRVAPGDEAGSTESQKVLEEFLEADVVVVGAPMYNLTIPTQLKAWIDRILVPGTTFQYGGGGLTGLAAGKRVIVALSRGSFYGEETASRGAEHAERYLRTVFGFIGIKDADIIIAEGIGHGPEKRAAALDSAHQSISALSF